MKNKKASIEVGLGFFINLFLAVIGIGILVVASTTLLSVLKEKDAGTDCLNENQWNDLKELLKGVDKSDFQNAEKFFDNENCNLVSFSFVHGIEGNSIQYPHSYPQEPLLCMCRIETSALGPDECIIHDCYKFKNYDQINSEQFSTESLKKYVFLKFIKDGKTLRIESIGTQKQPQPVNYFPEQNQEINPDNLINNMTIIFAVRDVKEFRIIVKEKEQGFLIPEGVVNIEGFTKFFDLELTSLPLYGQTEEDYLVNHQTIDPMLVNYAALTLSISKEAYQLLTDEQKQNINLYYKQKNIWRSSDMECTQESEQVLCNTLLIGFSQNFAISTIQQNE